MVRGLLHLDAVLKEIDIKRQELNSLVYNTVDYHSGVILEKSRELDKLIAEFYETKQQV
ncbi:MAG: aspartyl-phosphate phosphatase Spo0E family protein [Ruminiclostridium sp.]